jgi:hypothetical protein
LKNLFPIWRKWDLQMTTLISCWWKSARAFIVKKD